MRAELEEGALSKEETRAPNEREIRVARRRRVVEDREQHARELEAPACLAADYGAQGRKRDSVGGRG